MRHFWLGILVGTMMLAACGDDDSDFATRPDGKDSSSSSVILSSSEGSSPSSSSSSSSKAKSSSSVAYVEPCRIDSVDSCEYGSLTDSRDGKTYKTVSIGTQTWMAENLNYETANSYCYDDEYSKCSKYGRLYLWSAAMDSVGKWSMNGKGCGYDWPCSPTYPVRGICPAGWHLPTKAEFETLFTAVGGSSTAGKVLKSTSGWNSGAGTDAYGFSALPAGYRGCNGGYYFHNEGRYAVFWSSTEYDSCHSYYSVYSEAGLYDDIAYLFDRLQCDAISVRCVKD